MTFASVFWEPLSFLQYLIIRIWLNNMVYHSKKHVNLECLVFNYFLATEEEVYIPWNMLCGIKRIALKIKMLTCLLLFCIVNVSFCLLFWPWSHCSVNYYIVINMNSLKFSHERKLKVTSIIITPIIRWYLIMKK